MFIIKLISNENLGVFCEGLQYPFLIDKILLIE